MATKKTTPQKNIDPGRPVSRPMAPIQKDSGWGKTLSKEELLGLVDRIYAKREEEKEMSKLSDTLKAALAKKKGIQHPETDDAPVVEKKTKAKTAPATGKKPPTRSAGRGR